jgi:hypothetical protein
MGAPLISLAAMAGLALGYVVASMMAEVVFRFGGRRTVRCPETGLTAEVKFDARHAALSAVPGSSARSGRTALAVSRSVPHRRRPAEHGGTRWAQGGVVVVTDDDADSPDRGIDYLRARGAE